MPGGTAYLGLSRYALMVGMLAIFSWKDIRSGYCAGSTKAEQSHNQHHPLGGRPSTSILFTCDLISSGKMRTCRSTISQMARSPCNMGREGFAGRGE